MDCSHILSLVDHTLLSPNATWEEIRTLCRDAIKYKTATVCIPPSYISACRKEFPELKLCTVIGFPLGYMTTAAKCAEAADAVKCGADEIDMVINIGWVKDGRFDDVLAEINAVKAACGGKLLKVIIETCQLTDAEKLEMCRVVSASDADFIKTSTGFSTGGATREDIALMASHMTNGKKIKAAGGIASLKDAEEFIRLGAHRLGTSRIVKIVKGIKADEHTSY